MTAFEKADNAIMRQSIAIPLVTTHCTYIFNPNSEGVPATHLSEGGGLIQPPPGKCSINGPNELKLCVTSHWLCLRDSMTKKVQSCVRLQAESKIQKSKNFRNFEIRIYFSFFFVQN